MSRYLYANAFGAAVPMTITNVSSTAVALSACEGGSIVLPVPEFWTGQTWRSRAFASCNDNGLVARPLAAGESVVAYASLRSLGLFRIPLYVNDRDARLAAEVSRTVEVY